MISQMDDSEINERVITELKLGLAEFDQWVTDTSQDDIHFINRISEIQQDAKKSMRNEWIWFLVSASGILFAWIAIAFSVPWILVGIQCLCVTIFPFVANRMNHSPYISNL